MEEKRETYKKCVFPILKKASVRALRGAFRSSPAAQDLVVPILSEGGGGTLDVEEALRKHGPRGAISALVAARTSISGPQRRILLYFVRVFFCFWLIFYLICLFLLFLSFCVVLKI